MIRNSPLFIQKIMTLVVFSFFFSFLTSLFDVVGMEEEKISKQTTILFMLAGEALVGLIYFTLIYFCLKRKNSARVILVIFIIFGFIMYGYSLISAEYSTVQWIFYVTSMILDVYILILLLSKQANSFFKSSYIQNEVTGSYKAWFSTLSSILFVVMIGAKFLNKHEINQTNLVTNQSAESQPADEMAASEELEENNNQANEDTVEQDTATSSDVEQFNCKDPNIISAFIDTMNNSPSALSNNIKVIDVDTDYIEEVSLTTHPYELKCSVTFTLNDASEANFLMRIYDKNGKGKMMIEGTPLENQGE